MKEENVVTVKVQMDTSEAEAVIDRLTAKLTKMAEMLKEATPQHGELASGEINASLDILDLSQRFGPTPHKWGLRDALLKCSTLSEAEVDEYIAYECEGIVFEDVPLDYELEHPDAEVSCLYSGSIVQSKTLRRHTNQISPETLEKVRRVLPLIYL